VSTACLRVLFVIVVLAHHRRRVVHATSPSSPALTRPSEKGHFSYFILEADQAQRIFDLFQPMKPEVRALELWSNLMARS
jgi:hypothetical protein